ncbi:TolC family protein [Flavihumibacter profundi]|uniref:TolC family protein n=1 Tax=Flavihumibacter profundi TaxID=2716883 RepID=UPI001CC79D71|nr:TolC family protein [Flavihumibacter profundi]MBZ5858362.1 TolC family protein [Flavihumibacter profundi]
MPLHRVVAIRQALPVLIVFFCSSVIAQTSSQNYLSLNKAVSLALSNYPSILSKKATLNAAKATLAETKKSWLPNLKVSDQLDAGSNNNLNGAYFPMSIVPSNSGGRRLDNNSTMAIGNIATAYGDWEVYNFGLYGARNREADAALRIQEYNLGAEEYNIESAVIGNYLDLVKFQRLAGIQLKNIERTQIILDAIKAFVKSGLKPAVDSSVAAAELSKARLTYLDLVNTVQLLKIQLATFTGLDSAQVRADTALNILQKINLSESNYLDSGYFQHPLLKYQYAIYEDNLAQQNLIKKTNLPKISIMAAGWMRGSSISPSDEYKNLSSGFSYTRYNYLAGLAVIYNFTDLKRTQLKLNVQKYKSTAALETFNEQKTQLANAQAQANSALQNSIVKLAEIPIQKNAASAAYLQRNALYNAGLTNIVDLTNALYLLNRAETDEVLAADEAWKAFFRKMYAGNQVNQFISLFK